MLNKQKIVINTKKKKAISLNDIGDSESTNQPSKEKKNQINSLARQSLQ